MGCCQSAEGQVDKERNDAIEQGIKKDKQDMKNQVKMLLLGAGESGKSTILKQMKIIHHKGYSSDERESHKDIIFSNTIRSMQVILEAMDDLHISLGNPNKAELADLVRDYETHQVEKVKMTPQIAEAIKSLWADDGVKEAFDRRNEFQLNDSAEYYFDVIDRIGEPYYQPTDQDVLRSRVKTTGISETVFQVGELSYRMFDVGGQRSERKKWIHCFEDVTAIIFLVAISEYDQVLIEDESMNRLSESLTLFDSICNSRWFEKTSIILFLNKTDLFEKKLREGRNLSDYFDKYRGPNNPAPAREFIKNAFVELNRSENKQIYTHFTCATDTDQVKVIMNAVNDTILQNNLKDIHLI